MQKMFTAKERVEVRKVWKSSTSVAKFSNCDDYGKVEQLWKSSMTPTSKNAKNIKSKLLLFIKAAASGP